ncbi:MAG: energy transducer TonB, partial [Bacteroidaceae bacterium]|nr:energy transducer TonB [Bacteroidaceae bacterium]
QEESDEGEIFEVVEQNPMFPGGEAALLKYLQKNLKYPAQAQDNGIQGRVMVQFVVNKDGSVVEPKIIRSVDPSLDKEAMRVVSAMPKWTPGKQRGKTVRVRYTLPVTFRLGV